MCLEKKLQKEWTPERLRHSGLWSLRTRDKNRAAMARDCADGGGDTYSTLQCFYLFDLLLPVTIPRVRSRRERLRLFAFPLPNTMSGSKWLLRCFRRVGVRGSEETLGGARWGGGDHKD